MKKTLLTSALIMITTLGLSFEKEPTKLVEQGKTEIVKKPKPRVYYWEVTTIDGTANGQTTSRRLAKKSIKQFAKGTILSSKIIESYETVSTKK